MTEKKEVKSVRGLLYSTHLVLIPLNNVTKKECVLETTQYTFEAQKLRHKALSITGAQFHSKLSCVPFVPIVYVVHVISIYVIHT